MLCGSRQLHRGYKIRNTIIGQHQIIFRRKQPPLSHDIANLAKYNEKLGNIQEAIRLDTKALEIRKKILGEEHPDYANSLNNLTYYYSHIDKTEEAIRLCTQAMEIRKKILGENGRD